MQTAARPQTGARPPGSAPVGCYKCGQTGHWARDCPAPPSQWIPRQPQAGGQGRTPGSAPGAGAPPAAAENDPLNPEAAAAADGTQAAGQTAAALKKEKRKRPKLTLELLQSSKGMPDVLVNFPDAFRRQFKGRGHEASDLRRLLEMYKRWQDRVFPHGDFDSFIGNVERLSGTCALRHEVHELRMRLLREVQDIADPPHVQLEEDGPSPGAAADGEAPQALRGAATALGDDDDDMELQLEHPEEMDDELMGLLMDPAEGAGPAGAAAIGGAAAAAPAAADEDDGLMELIDEDEEEPAGQQAQQAPQQGFAEEEDDELMQLLEESENVAPAGGADPAVHAAVTAGAAGGEQAMETEAGAAATDGPAATTATAAAAAAEEERQLAALADDGLPPSQSVLPGSTLPGNDAAPAFSAGTDAGAVCGVAVGSEEDALLALLEEEDGQPTQQAQQAQQGGMDGSSGASQLPLVQPSPEFGAFPLTAADAQLPASQAHAASQAVGTATATAGGSQAAVGSEEEAAAAVLASPVLGPGTEVAGAFPPDSFVPESEPISDPTQEL